MYQQDPLNLYTVHTNIYVHTQCMGNYVADTFWLFCCDILVVLVYKKKTA